VGRRVIPWTLHLVAHMGSRELFRLAVLGIALGVAYGAAQLFGVSLALGAFFAGMVLSESELSHQAANETLPLRDAFAVLFFVSVGMLFDPMTLLGNPLPIIGTLFIILAGKTVAAFLIVIAFRHPIGTALTIAASLAQIGEFSFILIELGLRLNLLPEQARPLILGGAILSILINPLMFIGAGWLQRRLEGRKATMDEPQPPPASEEPLVGVTMEDHVILVGHGRVGSMVAEALQAANTPFVVIEDSEVTAVKLREAGITVLDGNAVKSGVLAAANLTKARQLVVAIPDAFEAGQVIQQARAACQTLPIIARAQNDPGAEHLTAMGADTVIMGEVEIARGMIARLAQGAAAATAAAAAVVTAPADLDPAPATA
jgi:CPA2 family monovalent cation:H+ antiporter-2